MCVNIHEYLKGDRLDHTMAVEDLSKFVARRMSMTAEETSILTRMARLHDIGYSDKIEEKLGFHPVDGTNFLIAQESNTVLSGILYHSDSDKLSMYMGINTLAQYKRMSSMLRASKDTELIDLLSFCDMSTDSKGNNVTIAERCECIGKRYGYHDYRYLVARENMRKYEILAGKILNRVG